MKPARTKTWVCLLLSICLFFSGMCFDTFKTDSFSSFTQSQNVGAYLREAKSQISKKDVCTEKLIGVRDAKTILTGHIQAHKKSVYKDNPDISFLRIIPILSAYLLTAETMLPGSSTTCSSGYIIQYIHCQDGEKAASNRRI